MRYVYAVRERVSGVAAIASKKNSAKAREENTKRASAKLPRRGREFHNS